MLILSGRISYLVVDQVPVQDVQLRPRHRIQVRLYSKGMARAEHIEHFILRSRMIVAGSHQLKKRVSCCSGCSMAHLDDRQRQERRPVSMENDIQSGIVVEVFRSLQRGIP